MRVKLICWGEKLDPDEETGLTSELLCVCKLFFSQHADVLMANHRFSAFTTTHSELRTS